MSSMICLFLKKPNILVFSLVAAISPCQAIPGTGIDATDHGSVENKDSLTLSLAFPGKRVLLWENFDHSGLDTLAQQPGRTLSGSAFSITHARDINMQMSRGALMIDGKKEGRLVFRFDPFREGRVRVSLNVIQTSDSPAKAGVYLIDSEGRRGPALRWDAKSQWPASNASVEVSDGTRVSFPALVVNKSAGKPTPWAHVKIGTLRMVADLDGQNYLMDTNLNAAWNYYKDAIPSVPFENHLADIAGVEIEVLPGSGSLILDNLKVEGPVFGNEEINQIRVSRPSPVEPLSELVTYERVLQDSHANMRLELLQNAVIWETNPLIDAPEGYSSYAKLVPHLKDLGVNLIYFVCQWHSTDYFPGGQLSYPLNRPENVAPGYGNVAEFKECIKMLKENGFRVMLDFGIHSAAWDSNILRERPEWFIKLEDGPFVSRTPTENFIYMVRFDIRRADVRSFLIETLAYWVDDIGIDALRIDLANHLFTNRPPEATDMPWREFWTECNQALRKNRPDLILLGESANQGMVQAGFDIEYDAFWRLRIRYLKRFIEQGKMPFGILAFGLSRDIPAEFPQSRIALWGLESHDFEPAASAWKGQDKVSAGFGSSTKARLRMALAMMLPGTPLLFSGQEWENRFYHMEGGRPPLPDELSAREFMKRLIHTRKAYALGEGTLDRINPLTPGGTLPHPDVPAYVGSATEPALRDYFARSNYPEWLAFGRETSRGRFVVYLNDSDEKQTVQLDFGDHPDWQDEIAAESINLTTGEIREENVPVSRPRLLQAGEALLVKLATNKKG